MNEKPARDIVKLSSVVKANVIDQAGPPALCTPLEGFAAAGFFFGVSG
ncbi:hypothetical protein [Burkholderia cepacia]|nr:hypothetical protein [Burkholderia cepacia]